MFNMPCNRESDVAAHMKTNRHAHAHKLYHVRRRLLGLPAADEEAGFSTLVRAFPSDRPWRRRAPLRGVSTAKSPSPAPDAPVGAREAVAGAFPLLRRGGCTTDGASGLPPRSLAAAGCGTVGCLPRTRRARPADADDMPYRPDCTLAVRFFGLRRVCRGDSEDDSDGTNDDDRDSVHEVVSQEGVFLTDGDDGSGPDNTGDDDVDLKGLVDSDGPLLLPPPAGPAGPAGPVPAPPPRNSSSVSSTGGAAKAANLTLGGADRRDDGHPGTPDTCARAAWTALSMAAASWSASSRLPAQRGTRVHTARVAIVAAAVAKPSLAAHGVRPSITSPTGVPSALGSAVRPSAPRDSAHARHATRSAAETTSASTGDGRVGKELSAPTPCGPARLRHLTAFSAAV